MAGQMPVAKFRAGQVSCALWHNEITVNGDSKSILKASIERRYKDREGQWKSSNSFSRNEIPLAIHCLQKAFETILREEQKNSKNNGGDAVGGARIPVEDLGGGIR